MFDNVFDWMALTTLPGTNKRVSVAHRVYVFPLLLLLCLCLTPLYAQTTASLVGSVHDSSGALVPKAKVSMRNPNTGFSLQVSSDSEGNYTMSSLPIGSYTLTAESKGFKQAQVANIILQVAQQARIDLVLVPGDVTQTVTVTDTSSLIQTETSSLGQVIDNKQIVDLPLNSRHVTQLIGLTAGALTSPVVGSGNAPNAGSAAAQNTGLTTATVSGGGEKTEFILDGLTNSESFFNGIQFEPSEDFVQEFRILSNGFPAQYGRGSAVVLMTTKGGTNQYHGTAFEFIRLDTPGFRTDAKNYFAAPGTALASLRQNQFGGSVGGPILKNRLFFFLNYDGTRSSIPTTKNISVPDANLRAGNLDSTLLGPAAVDPFSGLPFPLNASGNHQVPASYLNAASAFFLNPAILPLPNQPDNIHFIFSPARTNNVSQGNVRIDYQIGAKDTVFGRYSISDGTSYNPGAAPAFGGITGQVNGKNIAIGYAHIFSAKLLNQFHFGVAHFYAASSYQGLGTNYTQQAGILGFEQTSVQYPGFPTLFPGDYQSVTGNAFKPLINPTQTYQLSDLVTWVKGNHTLTMGLEVTRWHGTSSNPGPGATGFFGWDDAEYSGNGFVDYLIGLPDNGTRNFPRNIFGQKDFSSPLFIQDDWRITKNLTLNLGLRYDLSAAPVADFAQNSYFDLKTGHFIVSVYKNGQPNLVTQGIAQDAYNIFSASIVTAAQAGLSNNLQTMSKKTFAPRVGFAYRPFDNSKTVIRGAYGIFYDVMGVNQSVSQAFDNIPFLYDTKKVLPSGRGVYLNPSKNFENFFNFPFGTGGGPTINDADLNIHPPYNQQWNLAVQQELANNLSLTAAYVGNKGTHIEQLLPLNYPVWSGGVNLGRPYPTFGGGSNSTNVGNSGYNGLQLTLEKRYSYGLQLLSAFTWSKYIDEGSWDEQTVPGEFAGVVNPAVIGSNRGLGAEDIKLRWVTSAIYALPFGRGMRFGSNIPRPVDYLIGGWRLSTIGTLQSGSPFTPTASTQPFGSGAGYGTLPNRIGSGILSHPTVLKWFDATAFTPVPTNAGVYGTSGRNILRGPGGDIWDASLFKDFHFTDSTYLELRTDAFNVFNHPWFGQPATNIQSATVGQITSTAVSTNSRELQGSLKIYF
jgi:hypothetical protein